jgi:DNA polymerase III subunit delta'
MAGPPFLTSVRAQQSAVETLRRALALGRVHHAYLFDGPDGVGKERAAVGLAQALVCERRAPGMADACGACSACVRAVPRPGEDRPSHPDIVVLERGLYDPVTIGRKSPEAQGISIDQVRTLVLARAAFGPSEGRAKVFVIRRAEELMPAAANALLKTLEEPGAKTHFILLSSSADALMATIRSRTQRVRFGALRDSVIAELLVERGVDPARAASVAPEAGGSAGAALVLAEGESGADRAAFVSHAMAALEASDFGPSLDLAEEAKKADKRAVVGHLEALAGALRSEARATAASTGPAPVLAATRYALAIEAARQIEANGSVQLTVESMLIQMRAA